MIPKNWTKKGREEARREKERLERLDKTMVGIARLYVEDSLHHEYCRARTLWNDDWWKRYNGISEKTEAMLINRFREFGGKIYNLNISGNVAGQVDGYEIDGKLDAQFPDNVIVDSSIDELDILCHTSVLDDVLEVIRGMAPNTSLVITDLLQAPPEDFDVDELALDLPFSRLDADKWLAKRDIEVKVDFSDAPGPSQEQINKARINLEAGFRLLHPELDQDSLEALVEYSVEEAANTAEADKKA